MTTLLFSVLAATSLIAAGTTAPGETRSAQSLPAAQLMVPSVQPAGSNHAVPITRLADAAQDSAAADDANGDDTGKAACRRKHGHWNPTKLRCAVLWPTALIGAATGAGLGYALASGGDSGGPVSH